MKPDVFRQLKDHYVSVAKELSSQANQAGLLENPTGVGTQREEVYRAFLERHLPKMCDVFLGGYVFDSQGHASDQVDIIVTSDNTPRFRMSSGERFIAPLEGTIGVIEVKSRLNKGTLNDALKNCSSVPPMPVPQKIVAPYLKIPDADWYDIPYKIIYAYDGIDPETLCKHIGAFYRLHEDITISRRPNIIHVLDKYMVMRISPGMTVINPDGVPDVNQPEAGQYHWFSRGSDASAMAWALNALQRNAFLANNSMYKYDEWINKIVEHIRDQ